MPLQFIRRLVPALVLAVCPILSCNRAATPVTEPPTTADLVVQTPAPVTEAESTPDFAGADPGLVVPAPSTQPVTNAIERIRDEGLNRSQVMQTLSYLTDVIGPRLTGSPNLRRANEWTRKQLQDWGLVNAHLESWGPFGRGWSVRRFSAQIVAPQHIALIGAPKAWSPGFDRPIVADVIYLDAKSERDFSNYRGKLKGAIVLSGAIRDLQPRFEPPALRLPDTDLLRLANADPGAGGGTPPGLARGQTPSERRALLPQGLLRATTQQAAAGTQPTSRAASRPTTSPTTQAAFARNTLKFLIEEGAAVMVTPSTQGDGGTFYVAQASIPSTQPINSPNAPRPWAGDAARTLPQLMLATEDFNRLVRMLRQGEKLRMDLDLQVQFHQGDDMAYNTVAEIPGTDLKDQIVMLGAHLDSWHSGTGATDNGAGTAAVMEAVRILKATGLKPRRTIRIALWTGEEQGLFGSKAYVEKHFGKYETPTTAPTTRPSRAAATTAAALQPTTRPSRGFATSRPARGKFLPGPEFDKLSVYFNLDNGGGKIRGVYLQGNESVRPLFRRWLAPFKDLGAETISLSNTGGTDHTSFDAVGLPGFQFIQDPIEYWSRTHHSNQDTYDRIVPDDMKQSSTIIAAFVYNAAMMDEKVSRKPTTNPTR